MRLRRLAAPAALITAGIIATLSTPSYAGGPGTWTKLDSGARTDLIAVPGLARDKTGTLHVVFPQHDADSDTDSIVHIPVSRSGKAGVRSTVVSGWSDLVSDPKIAVDPVHGFHVYFAGLQDGDTSNPLSQGNVYGAYSGTGSTWALDGGVSDPVVYNSSGAYSDYGIDTVLLASGLQVSSYSLNSDIHVTVGSGTDTGAPSTFSWSQGAVSVIDTALTVRGQTVWLAWYQFGGGKDGVYVRQVYPGTPGPISKAPSSSVVYGGSVTSLSPEIGEPTPLVATSKGVFTAYCVGYPDCTRIAVWKIGASKPQLLVAGGPDSQHLALSTAPGGRLWLAWYDYSGGGHIEAARTNVSVTKLGAVRKVALPHGRAPYAVQVEGSLGPADLVVNTAYATGAPSTAGIFHTQVLPGLSLRASPKSWKHTKKHRVKLTVTDAGAKVKGAKVKVGTKKCTTTSNGTCTITFKRARKKATLKAKATRSGYAASVVVRLKEK